MPTLLHGASVRVSIEEVASSRIIAGGSAGSVRSVGAYEGLSRCGQHRVT